MATARAREDVLYGFHQEVKGRGGEDRKTGIYCSNGAPVVYSYMLKTLERKCAQTDGRK